MNLERKRRWAKFAAGMIHELHRVRIPRTNKVLLPLNVRVIEKILIEVHEVFANHDICFWLRDGTALGVVREGKVLSRDDDIDLGIWLHDEPKLELALQELEERGFVRYIQKKQIVALLKSWETVEIVVSGSWATDDVHNNFLDTFFLELKTVPYLGRDFNVPKNTEAYMEFSYGVDWRTPKPFQWWSNTTWLPKAERESHVDEFARGQIRRD